MGLAPPDASGITKAQVIGIGSSRGLLPLQKCTAVTRRRMPAYVIRYVIDERSAAILSVTAPRPLGLECGLSTTRERWPLTTVSSAASAVGANSIAAASTSAAGGMACARVR